MIIASHFSVRETGVVLSFLFFFFFQFYSLLSPIAHVELVSQFRNVLRENRRCVMHGRAKSLFAGEIRSGNDRRSIEERRTEI